MLEQKMIKSSLVALAIGLSASAHAAADGLPRALPPQSLPDALKAFAHLSGLQVIYRAEIAAGLSTKGANEGASPEQALQDLLRDTGLTYSFVNDRMVAIRTAGSANGTDRRFTAPWAGASLGGAEIAGGAPWEQFRVAQADQSSSPAHATAGAPSTSSESSPETPPTDESKGVIEEVMVTAERRTSNAQDVPIALTVLSAQALENYRIEDVTDVANHTPNFFFNQSRPSAPGLTIRGIGSNARQGQAGVDLSVIVYVDDVYIGRGGGQVFDLFDVERVEVLRGPQGTLFGRNAAGGAVHVITRKPVADPYAKFQISAGNYSFIETKGVINSPLTDTLWGKLSFSKKDRDGINHNIITDHDIEDVNSDNLRGQLNYVPSEDFRALLTVDYAHDKTDGVVQRPINGAGTFALVGFQPAPGWRDFQNDIDGFLNRDIYGISTHLDWNTSIGDLTSVTAYRVVKFDMDFPGVGALGGPDFSSEPNLTNLTPGFESRQPQREKGNTFTQEIRLASASESKLEWLVGGFYMNEAVDQTHIFKRVLRVVGAAAPTSSHTSQVQNSRIDSFAVFGSATYKFTDAWRLTLGARETWETRRMKEVATDLDPLKLNTNSIAPLLGTFSADNQKNYSAFTPAGTLSYFPQKGIFADTNTMLYASLSKGFKSGGFDGQSSSLASANTPFLPEKSLNREIGFKSQFFDDRVQFNLAAFWTTFKDMQLYQRVLTVPGNQATGTNVIVNVAEARIKGVEAEAIFVPTPNLRLTANIGRQNPILTDATLISSLPGADRDGLSLFQDSRLPRAPKTNYFLSAAYDLHVGNGGVVTLLASDRYTGDVFFDLGEPAPGGFQKGYHLADASISFVPSSQSAWNFKLWAKNLADKEYWVEQQSNGGGISAIGRIGEPRTYGITAEWNWE